MNIVSISIERIDSDAKLPLYQHDGDAGMDIYSFEECVINPGERRLVRTGLRVEIPYGYEIQIRPRSGLALKKGITVLNTPGTIDSGYRGELGVMLINHDRREVKINRYDRIAQLVLNPVLRIKWVEKRVNIESSTRSTGGFGSTGTE